MDKNGRNDLIRDLMIEILESGLEHNDTYIRVIEALDNFPGRESDTLVFLLEHLNLNSLALDLVVKQYKIKRIRDILSLNLDDFHHQNQMQINERNEEFFAGALSEQVFNEHE